MHMNKVCNEHFLQPGAVYIPRAPGKRVQLNSPQPMWLWPGMKVFGCVPIEKMGLRNGCDYVVASVDGVSVNLQNGPALTHEQASQWLRLPFSMTYASVQGRETSGTLCLHDCDNAHFTWRHLYVGLSRARLASDVRVE